MSVLPDDPIRPFEEPIPQAIENLDVISTGPPQYEFTSAQGDLLSDLARKMRFVGVLMIVVGVLNPLMTWMTFHAISLDVTFLIYILIGAWTWSAANSFRKVVDTEGKDVNHLMEALERLRRIYGFIFYLVIIGITIAGLLLFWGAVGGHAAFSLGSSPIEGQ